MYASRVGKRLACGARENLDLASIVVYAVGAGSELLTSVHVILGEILIKYFRLVSTSTVYWLPM